ncbi:hypothetical protein BsWGS_03120 [Bradybaena similaris]
MDAQNGATSLQESRAMKAARAKNKTQDKKLAQTIQLLDKNKKARSGQLMDLTCDTRDLICSINTASTTTGAALGHMSSNGPAHMPSRKLSMTLAEFDRRMQEKRDMARRIAASTSKNPVVVTRNKEKVYQNVYSILPAVDYESDMALYRKKQSMKDAWNRANSQDIKYKHSFHKPIAW